MLLVIGLLISYYTAFRFIERIEPEESGLVEALGYIGAVGAIAAAVALLVLNADVQRAIEALGVLAD